MFEIYAEIHDFFKHYRLNPMDPNPANAPKRSLSSTLVNSKKLTSHALHYKIKITTDNDETKKIRDFD